MDRKVSEDRLECMRCGVPFHGQRTLGLRVTSARVGDVVRCA